MGVFGNGLVMRRYFVPPHFGCMVVAESQSDWEVLFWEKISSSSWMASSNLEGWRRGKVEMVILGIGLVARQP